MGLERGPLSLVSTTEKLLERKNSGSGLESRDYGRRDSSLLLRDTPLSAPVGTNFGRYSSLTDPGHEVIIKKDILPSICLKWKDRKV
jgi:hypothetical protein